MFEIKMFKVNYKVYIKLIVMHRKFMVASKNLTELFFKKESLELNVL